MQPASPPKDDSISAYADLHGKKPPETGGFAG
jgi:hypothetical protein